MKMFYDPVRITSNKMKCELIAGNCGKVSPLQFMYACFSLTLLVWNRMSPLE